MSKMEILDELPKLAREDRREIFERICEMEERDLLNGGEPTREEKSLLDRELTDFQSDSKVGSSWEVVEARLRKPACE